MSAWPTLSGQVFVSRTDVHPDVVIQTSAAGYTVRYSKGSVLRYRYHVRVEYMVEADRTALETLFVTVDGRLGSFTFTDRMNSNASTNVCFDSDQLEIQRLGVALYRCEVDLISVI